MFLEVVLAEQLTPDQCRRLHNASLLRRTRSVSHTQTYPKSMQHQVSLVIDVLVFRVHQSRFPLHAGGLFGLPRTGDHRKSRESKPRKPLNRRVRIRWYKSSLFLEWDGDVSLSSSPPLTSDEKNAKIHLGEGKSTLIWDMLDSTHDVILWRISDIICEKHQRCATLNILPIHYILTYSYKDAPHPTLENEKKTQDEYLCYARARNRFLPSLLVMQILPWLLAALLLFLVLGMLRRLPLPYTNRASLHIDNIMTTVVPRALFAFLAPTSTLTKGKIINTDYVNGTQHSSTSSATTVRKQRMTFTNHTSIATEPRWCPDGNNNFITSAWIPIPP